MGREDIDFFDVARVRKTRSKAWNFQKGLPFGENEPRFAEKGAGFSGHVCYYKKCLKTAFTVTFSL
jgi:hypothetical protein